MVGTGAVIATARHIPVAMMLTEEIDIYAEGATDITLISDLIDGSIGRDSPFHRTFGYYGDGVRRSRAIVCHTGWPRHCHLSSADDIAIAKLCAWRKKDQAWLREAFRSGVVNADQAPPYCARRCLPRRPSGPSLHDVSRWRRTNSLPRDRAVIDGPEAWDGIRVKSAEMMRAALLGPKAQNVIAPEGWWGQTQPPKLFSQAFVVVVADEADGTRFDSVSLPGRTRLRELVPRTRGRHR